ncbi:sugar phosphate isomerase/epimerase family protein [Planctomicrobium sp. SH527]|uniref:sugar phosphate isomerase/epimerase family protein n=1 Tax=Planctomicrobium sp. SH527 TaxID=3448123 RepID=UPI003F5B6364
MRIRVSVPTTTFQTNLRVAIDSAMQIGADGVQFDLRSEVKPSEFGDSARRQILHYLKEHQLELASVSFPLRGPINDPDRLDQRLSAIRDAIQFASTLKVRHLTIRPGSIPPVDNKERESFIEIVKDLATLGNRFGVTLCLQPGGDSAGELIQMLNEIPTGQVEVDVDLAEWVMNDLPYRQELRDLFGKIGHLEGRDAARGLGSSGREVPLGRGEIDWEEIAALLNEMDYIGWINVQRTTGSSIQADVARGVTMMKQLFHVGHDQLST